MIISKLEYSQILDLILIIEIVAWVVKEGFYMLIFLSVEVGEEIENNQQCLHLLSQHINLLQRNMRESTRYKVILSLKKENNKN